MPTRLLLLIYLDHFHFVVGCMGLHVNADKIEMYTWTQAHQHAILMWHGQKLSILPTIWTNGPYPSAFTRQPPW